MNDQLFSKFLIDRENLIIKAVGESDWRSDKVYFVNDYINQTDIRILNNFINKMPKIYRTLTPNWGVVRDILLVDTSISGSTSCISKCKELELGIDPDGFNL